MPNCKTCGNEFERKIVVDGKKIVMTKRVRCLTCSPFGTHNTRKFSVLTCVKCKRPGRKRLYGSGLCNSCHVVEWRKRIKLKCVEHLGGKCIICGYAKSVHALHLHHKNAEEKSFVISGSTKAWSKIQAEVEKCVLVCANCHAEIHAGITTMPVKLS